MSYIKNIVRLERLSCIELYSTSPAGLGVKRNLYRIKDSDYFIKVEYWKGDDFYSYDSNYIEFIDIDYLKYPNDAHKYNKLSIQDCLKSLPSKAQDEVLMNLDLFTGI